MPTSKRGVKAAVIVSDPLVKVPKHPRLDLAAHTKVHGTMYDKNLLRSSKPALMVTLINSTKIKNLKITLFLVYSLLNTLLLSSNQFPH